MRWIFMFGFGVMCAALGAAGCADPPSAHVCASGAICPADMQCAANEPVCLSNNCGNGNPDPGEVCDDGNTTRGDGCSPQCTSETCGDGIVNNGEECDPVHEPATCDLDCMRSRCGDGKVNPNAGEECDFGGHNSDGGVCLTTCKIATCGDYQVHPGVEECDDGNAFNGDGCSNLCRRELCGNGI